MKLHELPPDICEALRKERRDTRVAAEAFASACEQGSVENFYQAVDMIHDMTVDGWRLALKQSHDAVARWNHVKTRPPDGGGFKSRSRTVTGFSSSLRTSTAGI